MTETTERLVLRQVAFKVAGVPAAQGSKDAIPFRKADGKLGVRVLDRKTVKAKIGNWRADVKEAALFTAEAESWDGPLDGPLKAVIHFTVPAVKLPARVRWAGVLLEAIHWPWRRPDLDKFLRATFDALTAGGVWHDDAQVVHLTASKAYPGTHEHALPHPGAVIMVRQLPVVRFPGSNAGLPADPVHEAAAVAAPVLF